MLEYIWTVGDTELLKILHESLAKERKYKADVIIALAEVDRRLLYAEKGYPCLLEFVMSELKLSKETALIGCVF